MPEINCHHCKKQFYANPSRLKYKVVSCSRTCASAAKIALTEKNEICPICNVEFHLKPFHKKRYKGPFTCSKECRGEFLKLHYKGDLNPNYKFETNLEKLLAERASSIKSKIKDSGLDYNISAEYLKKLYDKQLGLCYYTKIPMKLGSINFKNKGQADLDTLSVDKIIPKLGYTIDNVVLCCSAINKLKGNSTIEELNHFIEQLRLNYNIKPSG